MENLLPGIKFYAIHPEDLLWHIFSDIYKN